MDQCQQNPESGAGPPFEKNFISTDISNFDPIAWTPRFGRQKCYFHSQTKAYFAHTELQTGPLACIFCCIGLMPAKHVVYFMVPVAWSVASHVPLPTGLPSISRN